MKWNSGIILGIFMACVIVTFPEKAKADIFEVFLYYNQGTEILKFDEKKQPSVRVNQGKNILLLDFWEESDKAKGQYIIALYGVDGVELLQTQFQPAGGAFRIELPYVNTAKTLKILDTKSKQQLLNFDLTEFTSCDLNRVCEVEKNETVESCYIDCATKNVAYSQETQNLLRAGKGEVKDQKSGQILLKDERFADPTFSAPTTATPVAPPVTPETPSTTPGDATGGTAVNQQPVSVVKATLLGVFVFIFASGAVYFLRKRMRQ